MLYITQFNVVLLRKEKKKHRGGEETRRAGGNRKNYEMKIDADKSKVMRI